MFSNNVFAGSVSVIFFGNTVPEREVHIKIGDLPEVATWSDENGDFKKAITGVETGMHRTIIWVKDRYGNVGTEGEFFVSVSVGMVNVTVSNIDLSFKEMPSEEVLPSEECILSPDLNQDGAVGLVDFSILLYWWGSNNCKADLNTDGTVNFFDFGIFLNKWTG